MKTLNTRRKAVPVFAEERNKREDTGERLHESIGQHRDKLQYHVFCSKVMKELEAVASKHIQHMQFRNSVKEYFGSEALFL